MAKKVTGGMVVRLLKEAPGLTLEKKALKKAVKEASGISERAELKASLKLALAHLLGKGRVVKEGDAVVLIKEKKKNKKKRESTEKESVPEEPTAKKQRSSSSSSSVSSSEPPSQNEVQNPDGCTRVFLGNLHFEIDEARLRKEIPGITHIKWLTDKVKQTFCGTAFVELATPEEATAAVQKAGNVILNRALKANFAPARPGDVWPPPTVDADEEGGGSGGGWRAGGGAASSSSSSSSSVQRGDACTRVFLGNLSFKITEEKLGTALPGLKFVKWITDKETQQFYGSAFAEFATLDDATAAVAREGSNIMGRPLKANFAPARPGDVWPPVNGGGGFGGGGGGSFAAPSEKPFHDCRTLFMGNLSYSITDDDLAGFFAECGEIQAVRWLTHQDTGNFRGNGYVEFWESSAADQAILLNGQLLVGRPVKLDWDAGGRGGRTDASW